MSLKNFQKSICISILLIVCQLSYASKSVFIISNHNVPSKAEAFRIDGNSVTLQDMVEIDNYNPGWGAVGIDVWPEKELMFVTYESSDIVAWSSTKTLQFVGNYDTNVSNLAGIVVDKQEEKIYIVKRNYADLLIYTYNQSSNTLSYESTKILKNQSGQNIQGWGLALDEINDLIYVSTNSKTIYVYDTDSWTLSDPCYFDIRVEPNDRPAIGIAVDPVRGYLYTGRFNGQTIFHPYLVKTSLTSPHTSTEIDANTAIVGIDVDVNTGLIYCTTYNDQFRVYNHLLAIQDTETDPNMTSPAGVSVGGVYKLPLLYLDKDDGKNGTAIMRGDYIKYTITYGNPNDVDVSTVDIIDELPDGIDTNDVTFSSGGDYNSTAGTVTWNDLSLPACPNKGSVWVKVKTLSDSSEIITNCVEMESALTYNDEVCIQTPYVIFVDVNATGSNNGFSWTDAYSSSSGLESALTNARLLDGASAEIWVAEGTYTPSLPSSNKTFSLVDGVKMYGGYPTGGGQRDWLNNETILKKGSGVVSYVVTADGVGEETVIDGFIIRDADNSGMYCYQANPLILRVQTICNYYYGIRCGGSIPTSPKIENCIIRNNTGYGIYTQSGSSPMILNNTIVNNLEYGIYKTGSGDPNVSNCILWYNGTQVSGVTPTYSCIQYWTGEGTGNITGDANNPQFADANAGNYHLTYSSPCIDRGDSNVVGANEMDIDGEPRRMGECNEFVDMGADESFYPNCWNCPTQCHADVDCDGFVDTSDWPQIRDGWLKVYPNPAYTASACADNNRDGSINTNDWPQIRDWWLKSPPDDCVCGGPWPPNQGRGESGGDGSEGDSFYSKEEYDAYIEEMLEWLEEYQPPGWEEFIKQLSE